MPSNGVSMTLVCDAELGGGQVDQVDVEADDLIALGELEGLVRQLRAHGQRAGFDQAPPWRPRRRRRGAAPEPVGARPQPEPADAAAEDDVAWSLLLEPHALSTSAPTAVRGHQGDANDASRTVFQITPSETWTGYRVGGPRITAFEASCHVRLFRLT